MGHRKTMAVFRTFLVHPMGSVLISVDYRGLAIDAPALGKFLDKEANGEVGS
jgi:hypothetical protein